MAALTKCRGNTLIADLTIQKDGGPLDPAAWADWLECIRNVKQGTAHKFLRSEGE
jgi:hypothetical protein